MKYIVFILILLVSCSSLTERQRVLNRVNQVVAKNVEAKFYLHMGGAGVVGPGKIKALEYFFIADYSMDLNNARKLVVEVTDLIKDLASKDEQLQLEIENPPFGVEHIFMSIRFQTESTEKDLNLIDRISIFHEEIDYQKRNEITGKYELVHTETLEEAREKY